MREATEVDAYRDNGNGMEKKLYEKVAALPVIDFHCHLSPREIYEDKPFSDIGELWLAADHYKWRLMRTAGVSEKFITGDASYKEKYLKFTEVVSTALGNPIREWAAMELSRYFNIGLKICPQYAERIWEEANAKIVGGRLSPRKLIEWSNVEYIATTDDISDDLRYHNLLKDYKVKITPTFRTDKLFLIDDLCEYNAYIKKLGDIENIQINNLNDLKDVLKHRLYHFVVNGCSFSDIGAEGFPSVIFDDNHAEEIFGGLLRGKEISAAEKDGFFGNLYFYLGCLYAENNIVQQWHLAAARNCNDKRFAEIGPDGGYDCVGDIIDIRRIRNMLNALNNVGRLPTTIIYALNPAMNYPLTTLCGAFENVRTGISWWFNDHKRGLRDTFSTVSELQHITSLAGMVTDSRSFLSYVRHDYFRRILCGFLAENATESDFAYALETAEKLCYKNARALIGE